MTVKIFIMLQMISILNKCHLLNFLFIEESWKNVLPLPQKQLSSTTVFNTDNTSNNKCFLSSKSAYIFEGSCDTEDRNNDAYEKWKITALNFSFGCVDQSVTSLSSKGSALTLSS